MYSEKRKFGNIGEDMVAKNLEQKGFKILTRNYLKKWGEIDIVARDTEQIIHFIEVKTVSREINDTKSTQFPRETWRPEDNVHEAKLKRMHRAIESWLMEYDYDGEWQIDIAAVTIDEVAKRARVRYIDNII